MVDIIWEGQIMELLEKTIFKKKNKEIESLQQTILCISKKSNYNYAKNRKLRTENLNLTNENDELTNLTNQLTKKVHCLVGQAGGYVKEINKLKKIIEDTEKKYTEHLKSLENLINMKDKSINELDKKLENTIKQLEESMTDKFLVKKVRPATAKQKQTMKVKSGYLEGKIIRKIKE